MRFEFKETENIYEKRCGTCKVFYKANNTEEFRSHFYKNRDELDGYMARCKKCDYKLSLNKKRNHAKQNAAKRKNAPIQHKARMILNNAVALKKILKPKECSKCLATGQIHGHHHDYSKPLSVIWVCRKCHKDIHDHAN